MKKHELLVPVGNYESLIAAINNGADAVYLGGKKFGARAFASNFSLEELESVIKLCHLYDVKVYITVNTLVYDDEISEALEYIKKLHVFGVDAVIMQDVGLINLVHQTLPNLEIHASTQMHTHSKASLHFLEELGVKRVVFAREMSLEEITSIESNLEKEVFIHGSLCISYSGQCLFSSCILNRSGNRGQCAGMCRLPYKLLEDDRYIKTEGNYLLSPKDLCTVDNFKELLDSDVTSFKIEGRMKSPAYVAVVTRLYRSLIDQYENGQELKVNENDFNLLKMIFNREYTKGYLFNDFNIMNYNAPNHMGVYIGKVLEITNKKIKVKLESDLHQFESIRFKSSNKGFVINFMYDAKDNLINKASEGDIVYFDNFINLKNKDDVLLTSPLIDINDNITKKIKINIKCIAKLNAELILVVNDNQNEVILKGDIVQMAKTSPLSKDRIKECLSKCGNTPFEIESLDIEGDDDIFISVGMLNSLRRDALNKLKEIRENIKIEYIENEYVRPNFEKSEYGPVINVAVRSLDQINACKDLKLKNIIVSNHELMKSNFIFKVPRDSKMYKYDYDDLVVTDYASLDKYPGNIADYHLNVTNHYSFDYLQKKAKSVMLSVEMNLSQINNLLSYYSGNGNPEVLVYGRIELMLLKHCPLKNIVNKDKICSVCQNSHQYYFEDRNKEKYPIVNNSITHSTTILNSKPLNMINDVPMLKEKGVNSFRVELFDEDYAQTKEVLTTIIDKIFTQNI